MSKTRPTSKARQRIVETAERLFYADGIRAVGIDRIIAEAEVAKMTLYNHFASKDDLILAVLKHRDRQFAEFLQAAIDREWNRFNPARRKPPVAVRRNVSTKRRTEPCRNIHNARC